MSFRLSLVVFLSVTIFSRSTEGIFNINLNSVRSAFTATDCGGRNAALRFNSVSVTPQPIAMPGTIRIAVNVDIVRNISQTMSADIRVSRRVDFGFFGHTWFDVTPPCLPGQQCRTDLCTIINNTVQSQGCPAEVIGNGFTCTCPPITGSYVTRSDLPLLVEIRESDLPHQIIRDLIRGTYKIRASMYDGSGSSVGCFEARFGLVPGPNRPNP